MYKKFNQIKEILWRNLFKWVLILLCGVAIIFYYEMNYLETIHSREPSSLLAKELPKQTEQACSIPILEVNSEEILRNLMANEIIKCTGDEDWVEINGSTAKITDAAKKKYGFIKCHFTEVIRQSDHTQELGITTTTHTEYQFEGSDVVHAKCSGGKNSQYEYWSKLLVAIRHDQEILDRSSWSKVPDDALKLNVLMFGLDSLSHNMWKRKLPITYNYSTKELKGIALNGYNIVGDGTPQALIPILTGKTELELPETRKRMGSRAQHVNVYPFIWNDFRKYGYVTAWTEDMFEIGTFTYRLKGFKEQPTDHYMRTYYQELQSSEPHASNYRYCYKGRSTYDIFLSFVKNTFEVYPNRPKFVFGFHSQYSHDTDSLVVNADVPTYKMLKEFHQRGFLNDTLLILMSDHGARFSYARNTQQGKQEERLPAFIFVFPSWFEKKYPRAIENFKKNVDRLSTPFDIHETLKDVLHFRGAGIGSTQFRGISLFKEIPLSRTCQDAGIDPQWCTCLEWEAVSIAKSTVTEGAKFFTDFVNDLTEEYRTHCAKLKLKEIMWSAKLMPNQMMLHFKKSDMDGIVGDMSANTQVTLEVYQLKVSLDPGNAIYEASFRYNKVEKKFFISEKEISRINKYSQNTHCIEDKDIMHHLRKYCYCV